MRSRIAAALCLAALGASAIFASSLAIAQQKTARACVKKWQADKTPNRANGITQRAYLDRCVPPPEHLPAIDKSTSPCAATSARIALLRQRSRSRSPAIPAQAFINSRIDILERQSGKIISALGQIGNLPGEFNQPHSVAVDSQNNLYFVENRGRRFHKFYVKARVGTAAVRGVRPS
jgi:hypothetical protein